MGNKVDMVFDSHIDFQRSVGYAPGDLFKIALVKSTGLMYTLVDTVNGIWTPSGGADGQPTPGYKFFLPCTQKAAYNGGQGKDFSGKGADLLLRGSYSAATAWGTAGYFVSGAGTDLGGYVPNADSVINITASSLLYFFKVKQAAPGSSVVPIGNGIAGVDGIYFSFRATGKILTAILSGGAGATAWNTGESPSTVLDNTDHTFALAINKNTKEVFIYVDGYLDAAFTGGSVATIASSFSPPRHWNLGAGGAGGGAATTLASQTNSHHMIEFPNKGLPLNLDELVLRLHTDPAVALREGQFKW